MGRACPILHQAAVARTALGMSLNYRNHPEHPLSPTIADRCRSGTAVAVAGPPQKLNLRYLFKQHLIEGSGNLDSHPFMMSEHIHAGVWTTIAIPATPYNEPLREQVRGCRRGVRSLPSAIALAWLLVLWHQRHGERLLGSKRIRTRSLTADGERIVVRQSSLGSIGLSTADDNECASDLVAVKQLHR